MAAEAALLADDLDRRGTALGRTPDTFRETVRPGLLSTLWRLHGRVAFARADQSRAIALHQRALKHAETAHDSARSGWRITSSALCYRQVGDIAIVRDHITKAASALHAAGDRRHLALVQSLSSIPLAQVGSYEEALAALRQAERFAGAVQADDVLATICGNQANVMMLQHRYDQALALAERSVALHEAHGSGHGLAVALATLGQICVRLGELGEREEALNRALDVRSPIQFHETTGAVFDTLAQIHLIRGRYDAASECLGRAGEAYGAYGRQTSRWYEWSVRVLGARLALRRGALDEAVAQADEIIEAGAPPFDALQATLIAAEALIVRIGSRRPKNGLRPSPMPSIRRVAPAGWGEYLRLRGALHAKSGSGADAYHDFSQSAALLDLLGERYQSALSHLALGRFVAETGARSVAERHLNAALAHLRAARRRTRRRRHARRAQCCWRWWDRQDVISPADADDAIVRRMVDAAALPDLLGRETASALLEACAADCGVVYVAAAGRRRARAWPRSAATSTRRARWRAGAARQPYGRGGDRDRVARPRPRRAAIRLVASPRPIGHPVMRQLRTIAAVARQGFALCAARDRTIRRRASPSSDRSNRCCRDSCRPAPPWRASSSRSSACRATTSPCSSPAKAERARSSSRAPFTSDRIATPRCSCPTTARRPAAISRTASCSGIGAAASPARSPISRGWCAGRRRDAVSRRNRRPAARRAAEAPALPRAAGNHADRRDEAAEGGRAGARGHQRRPRAARRGGQVPRGSLLPAQRHPHPRAAVAASDRRKSRT